MFILMCMSSLQTESGGGASMCEYACADARLCVCMWCSVFVLT